MISENGNIPFKKSILYSNVILSFVVITSSAVEITGVIKLYRREWGGLHHVSIANLTTTEISKWNTKRTPGWNGVGSEFAVTLSLNQTISSKLLSGEVIGEWSSYLQGLLPYTSLVLSRLQKKFPMVSAPLGIAECFGDLPRSPETQVHEGEGPCHSFKGLRFPP